LPERLEIFFEFICDGIKKRTGSIYVPIDLQIIYNLIFALEKLELFRAADYRELPIKLFRDNVR